MCRRRRLENDYVDAMLDLLGPRFAWIKARSRPVASPSLREAIERDLGHCPLLQPEIDLCMQDEQGRLFAIEIKACSRVEAETSKPFYQGIGQALALLTYGFDAVALWFVFEEDGANRSGAQAWWFIRNQLNLPLDFTYYVTERSDGGRMAFRTHQYEDDRAGHAVGHMGRRTPQWRHANPLADSREQTIVRRHLQPWLAERAQRYTQAEDGPRGPDHQGMDEPEGMTGPVE